MRPFSSAFRPSTPTAPFCESISSVRYSIPNAVPTVPPPGMSNRSPVTYAWYEVSSVTVRFVRFAVR